MDVSFNLLTLVIT
jgi:hypothetical protein